MLVHFVVSLCSQTFDPLNPPWPQSNAVPTTATAVSPTVASTADYTSCRSSGTASCDYLSASYGDAGCCPSTTAGYPGWARRNCALTAAHRFYPGSYSTAYYNFSADGSYYTLKFDLNPMPSANSYPRAAYDSLPIAFGNYEVYQAKDDRTLLYGKQMYSTAWISPMGLAGYHQKCLRFSCDFTRAVFECGGPLLYLPQAVRASYSGLYPAGYFGDNAYNGSSWQQDPFEFALNQPIELDCTLW